MSVAAIVLAAGGSRRMGTCKALLPWPIGENVLGAVLRAVGDSNLGPVIVVAGDERPAVEAIARTWGAECAPNADWERGGMLSSLQVGLRALSAEVEATLVVLADQPGIPAGVHRAVVAAGRAAGLRRHIVRPELARRPGHPVLFGRDHFTALLALDPAGRPRDVILGAPERLVLVTVDDLGVVEDLDTPEDYERALLRATGSPR